MKLLTLYLAFSRHPSMLAISGHAPSGTRGCSHSGDLGIYPGSRIFNRSTVLYYFGYTSLLWNSSTTPEGPECVFPTSTFLGWWVKVPSGHSKNVRVGTWAKLSLLSAWESQNSHPKLVGLTTKSLSSLTLLSPFSASWESLLVLK